VASRQNDFRLNQSIRELRFAGADEGPRRIRGTFLSRWRFSEGILLIETRSDVLATNFARALRLSSSLKEQRAQGKPDADCAPAASCAKTKSTRAKSPQVRAGKSGFPRANGFNGFLRALSGDRAFLSPSSTRCVSILANLMPASRHQDHTTSPSAIRTFVSCAARVHRIPRSTFVTIAKRPSVRRDVANREVFRGQAASTCGCDQLARRANHRQGAKWCQEGRHSGARVKRANFDVQLHIRESILAMAVMDLRGSIVRIAPECLHFCRGTDWRRAPSRRIGKPCKRVR
jgi:hypothetical protein